MMLATRCPYCRTTFRVVQDQLKLCNGIVRCGSCRQVFNGIEQLQSADAAAQAMRDEVAAQPAQSNATDWPASAAANPDPVTIVADEPLTAATSQLPVEPETTEDLNLILTPVEEPPQGMMPPGDFDPLFAEPARPRYREEETHRLDLDLQYDARREPRLADEVIHDESVHGHAVEVGAFPRAPATEVPFSPPTPVIEPDEDDPAYRVEIRQPTPEPVYEEPAFVQRAKRQERYGRVGRIATALLTLAMVPALFLQSVDAFHLRLGAMLPDAKPALARICQLIACRTTLPAQIESVSIDSYELHSPAKGETAYTLKVLMRNRSALSQKWPHLELTLKDATETPIVRRVFDAKAYLTDKQAIPRGFAGHTEQAITLQFDVAPPLSPVGYEVYLFYP